MYLLILRTLKELQTSKLDEILEHRKESVKILHLSYYNLEPLVFHLDT
jgi:hypothetical protein